MFMFARGMEMNTTVKVVVAIIAGVTAVAYIYRIDFKKL
jgi:hypothetical protein